MMTYTEFTALHAKNPDQARDYWLAGKPLRCSRADARAQAKRIRALDLSGGRNARLTTQSRALVLTGHATFPRDVVAGISLDDTPEAQAAMTVAVLAGLALGVASLALGLGILVEGAMDEDSSGSIVISGNKGDVNVGCEDGGDTPPE